MVVNSAGVFRCSLLSIQAFVVFEDVRIELHLIFP